MKRHIKIKYSPVLGPTNDCIPIHIISAEQVARTDFSVGNAEDVAIGVAFCYNQLELTGGKAMEKGRIIFLNGVTSAGKTSIVEALQERGDVFFYVVANDLFQEMVGEKYLRKNYWRYLSEVILFMYHTAKLYSDMGKNVLIDGILVEREEITPHYRQLLDILKENPLDIVEVYCPLELCRQRNLIRGDSYEQQSEEQAALMAKDIRYQLRVDTAVYSSAECAEQIIRALF